MLLTTLVFLPRGAEAQTFVQVASCGTAPRTLPPGAVGVVLVDQNGYLCVNNPNFPSLSGPVPLGTTGGWTPKVVTALTNTAVAIKTTTGWLGGVHCDNNNNAFTYVQIFNATTANVTIGTTAPAAIVPLSPNLAGGRVFGVIGEQFSTAISVAATTTPTGSTAPATNTLNCNFDYN